MIELASASWMRIVTDRDRSDQVHISETRLFASFASSSCRLANCDFISTRTCSVTSWIWSSRSRLGALVASRDRDAWV